MKNIFKNKIALTLLVVFISIVLIVLLHFIFSRDKIIINKIEEKNYLENYPEIYEKYGAVKSTYYSVSYMNSTYTCEKIVFRDESSLKESLEATNVSNYKYNEIFFIEYEDRVSTVLIKLDEKPTVYYCVSYESNKNIAKNILMRLFNIK